tara:strand:- start:500 stop:1108 length:609 start_codon:yes stop_codon:yes gene_type:complete
MYGTLIIDAMSQPKNRAIRDRIKKLHSGSRDLSLLSGFRFPPPPATHNKILFCIQSAGIRGYIYDYSPTKTYGHFELEEGRKQTWKALTDSLTDLFSELIHSKAIPEEAHINLFDRDTNEMHIRLMYETNKTGFRNHVPALAGFIGAIAVLPLPWVLGCWESLQTNLLSGALVAAASSICYAIFYYFFGNASKTPFITIARY